MNRVDYPTDAVLALTYRCDAKCGMCNIWRLAPQEQLTVDDYAKVPSSLKDINISGGEPFLRKEIVDIVKVVNEKCGGPRIVISTNGFRTEKIIQAMEMLRNSIPHIGIGVSVDGIGATHSRIRGVDGAFEKVMDTLNRLKARGFKNVRIGFTAMNDNVHEMPHVYDLACRMGFQFTTSVAQNSDIYFSTQDNEGIRDGKLGEALAYVMRSELKSHHPKRWMRAYFESGTLLFNEEQRRMLPCHAGIEFFYLAPEGNIYPCLSIPQLMGNLSGHSFEEVWESEQAQQARRDIKGCEQCWMICTARSALVKNLPRALGWIVKQKIKSHLSN
jgi:MoaA/NifB/PqqE/SkfB family radical SAM enzyme